MLSDSQGTEVGEFYHSPFFTQNFVNKSLLENKFTFQTAAAACVLVTPVSQLISPPSQVVPLGAPYSKALGKKLFSAGD